MRIHPFHFECSKTTRLSFVGSSLAMLAALGGWAQPVQAQSAGRSCVANWQCRDASLLTLDWCEQGQCQHRSRDELQCQLPTSTPGCWLDFECDDGDPSTISWCGDYDFFQLLAWGDRAPGRCHVAPRNGSACDGDNAPECKRNSDCYDFDPQTRNWCYQGQCLAAQRDDVACAEPESSCTSQRDCVDDDRSTIDWCYLGACFHAPADGAACEPTLAECEPVQVVLEHSIRGAVNNPLAGVNEWRVPGNGYQIRYIRMENGMNAPLTTSFTCFDTAQLSGEVVSAFLEVSHSGNAYDSQDPSETVGLVALDQVGCDEPGLVAAKDQAPDTWAEIFRDTNDGPLLAQFTVQDADQGNTQSIPLNQAGLDALEAALGSGAGFGLGGTLLTADAQDAGVVERVFRGTDGTLGEAQPSTKLVVTLKPETCSDASQVLVPVDVGYFTKATLSENNQVLQSFHFESPAKEHKFMPVGNRNVDNPLFGKGNVETRAYSVWDVSGVDNAVSAKLRIWGWQPSQANNFSGAYTSEDASETVALFSLDTHTPEQVINAPFSDKTNHEIDVPIFEDLGQGTVYGERVHTIDDEQEDLRPAFRADPTISCNPMVRDPGAPCGKWLEYELNAEAIAAINATNGLWSMGHAMTTIGENPLQTEWTNNGTIIDMSPQKASYPAYLTPEPQLVIQVAE